MQIWTHRGNPGPENTLEAFASAWDDGIRYFETDIHTTSDGVLVLAHDSSVRRLTGLDIEISDLTWSELQEIKIDGKFNWSTLSELHSSFPEAFISIDIKSKNALQPYLEWAKNRDSRNIVTGSFSGKRVRAVRRALPDACTALTPAEVLVISFGLGWFVNLGNRKRMAMVPRSFNRVKILNRKLERFCLKDSIPLIIWTINSQEELESISNFDITGIVTDTYPLFHESGTQT